MLRRWRVFVLVSFLIFFTFGVTNIGNAYSGSVLSKMTISKPVPVRDSISIMGKAGNDNDETPGEWYVGSKPPHPKPNAPVLLFVQGLNSTAQTWWGDNDMYDTAVEAGYQTAFVQLYDAGGASADMWDNGELLANKIEEIYHYFGDRPLTIVAHSKGGVDTQTALAYFNAWRYVGNIITLSSPHHGSELADLAYSSWAGWLTKLLGDQGDGTYSLQTANMTSFRSVIDALPEAHYNHYYTLGGTNWGSIFSSTWMGGIYLNQYGDSDGVVTTSSSRLPGGTQLAIGDWNHGTIHTGVTFPVFEPYLNSVNDEVTGKRSNEKALEQQRQVNNSEGTLDSNQWLHGGSIKAGDNSIAVTVEDKVKGIIIDILTTQPINKMYWINPKGKSEAVNYTKTEDETGVFKGADHHIFKLKKPRPGDWTLHIESKHKDAYLLIANYDSKVKMKLNKTVETQNKDQSKSKKFKTSLKTDDEKVINKSLKLFYKLNKENDAKNIQSLPTEMETDLNKTITVQDPDNIYNLTIDIEGKTKAGYPFKRTVVKSF